MKRNDACGGMGDRTMDLHIHSTVSDGTDPPETVLSLAGAAGLAFFSVTDHDGIRAAQLLPSLLKEGDPRFLTGVEFSCWDDEGKYHILGYGFDPGGEAIGQVVEESHRLRLKKLDARLDFIRTRFGFDFPEEELRRLRALDNPGKPHLGNLMVKYGYAETRQQAIREYIDLLILPDGFVRPEEAIRGVLQSGGVPVLAHPVFGDGNQLIAGEELDLRLRRLMGMGLSGVEAFYSGFSAAQSREVLELGEKYGLYVTAGSDYHGANKSVRLGDTGLGKEEDWPGGLRRFLRAAGLI